MDDRCLLVASTLKNIHKTLRCSLDRVRVDDGTDLSLRTHKSITRSNLRTGCGQDKQSIESAISQTFLPSIHPRITCSNSCPPCSELFKPASQLACRRQLATTPQHPKPPHVNLTAQGLRPTDEILDPKSRISFPTKEGAATVQASPICVGAWSWGDTATRRWREEEWPAVQQAFKTFYDAGINYTDTAEVYADGRSEEFVGKLIKDVPRESIVIQTKWFGSALKPSSFIHPVDAPLNSLKKSLEHLGTSYVDIYLMHGHIHVQGIDSVAKGLAKCVEEGLARAVGIANYEPDDVEHMAKVLAKYGVPLATNQCEYSVLRRWPEIHHNISPCRKLGAVFQGYSSLANGRLSGKYTVENQPPSSYKFSSYDVKDVEPVVYVLRKIGKKHGKKPASVALNWSVSKGAVPVVGIWNPDQATQAVEALGWRLSQAEVVEIDQVSFEGTKTITRQQG